MKSRRTRRAAGLTLVAAALFVITAASGAFAQEGGMDHSQLPMLEGPFETGPDVTQVCLTCHADAAEGVMDTVHWTWEYTNPITGDEAGKINTINNYCVSVRDNEPRCTSCHIGYGWADDTFDFEEASNVDCLACHDTTGTYRKFPTAAGHPVYGETRVFGGTEWPAPDLAAVAQSVGEPSRANCGSCHFTGGGGDAVKHGDLDTSLANPDFELDVHMDADGLDFSCQTCHVTDDHDIPGGRYVADWAQGGPTRCETCHTEAPHENEALDAHVAVVACQTCHIPEYARAQPTKMTWDWSVAGEPTAEGTHPNIIVDEDTGTVVYDSRKGAFTWAANVEPEYFFSNGVYDWTLLSDTIDPVEGFIVNRILGDREDGKIWPYKAFTGIQPYDAATGTIAPLNLFPTGEDDTTAFWKYWDLEAAVRGGFEAYGLEYSGEMGFVDSVMYWPITHMVAPADQALGCTECHDADGRLDFAALGYDQQRAAVLASFPPVADEPEPTTTTAAPTTTEGSVTTTSTAPTTTVAASTTSTTVLAAGDTDDGGGPDGIVVTIILVLAVGGAVFSFWYFRRQVEEA